MNKRTFKEAPFQGVKETQAQTGLSLSVLYNGAKDGTFPHIRCGNRILFNVPAVLEVLQEMSTGAKKEGTQH